MKNTDIKPTPRIRHSVECSFLFQETPQIQFMTTEDHLNDDGNVCLCLVRDIAILLNQKLLTSQAMAGVVQSILSNVRTSAISDQFVGLSDDELISVIKSRYVQAPSELLQWSEWLEQNLTSLSQEAQEQVQAKVDIVEPAGPGSSDGSSE